MKKTWIILIVIAVIGIGAYSTCPHACVYCYANQSQNVVRARLRARKPGTESLI